MRTATSKSNQTPRSTVKTAIQKAAASKVVPIKKIITSKSAQPVPIVPSAPIKQNKQSELIRLLNQAQGASLQELIELSGWQAHSIRGFISGVLRKQKLLNVLIEKDASGVRRYRIEVAL